MRCAWVGFPTFCNGKKSGRRNKLQAQYSASGGWARQVPEPQSRLRLCFDGKGDRGEPHMFNVSVRPQTAAVAAVPAFAASAGETSSDEILVEQIAAGSKPAMQALFARHRTYVYRWLLRFVSNETLAEDLLSDVFLDVWRQAGRFQRRSSVSTWLLSIARHKALSARRRRTQGAELDEKIEATIADPANDPEVALQEKDRGELVRQALMRLSPQHREVIDLVYYHEKSVDEVAHILCVPPATIKTRMFYARKKLAEFVNRRWQNPC
jgi:RNA polymerase sigma-70 factor, ECF subfamily